MKKNSFSTNLSSNYNNFFHFHFETQLLTLIKKIETKKIINIFTFLTQLKNAYFHKFPLMIFYSTPYILQILKLLKNEFFIFNYFKITKKMLPAFLLTSTISEKFLKNLVCVIFKPFNLYGNLQMLQNIIFISTPSRTVFITYKQLQKLISINNDSTIFLINTSCGIVTHKIALKKKIGGSLLCKIY